MSLLKLKKEEIKTLLEVSVALSKVPMDLRSQNHTAYMREVEATLAGEDELPEHWCSIRDAKCDCGGYSAHYCPDYR